MAKSRWRMIAGVKKEETQQYQFPISHCGFLKVSHFLSFFKLLARTEKSVACRPSNMYESPKKFNLYKVTFGAQLQK